MGDNKNDNNKKIKFALRSQNRHTIINDRTFNKNNVSYEDLEENGYQFHSNYDVYSEIEKQEKERQEWQSDVTQDYLQKLRIGIKNNLHRFTPYQQRIIKMRFGQNLSIAEIAKHFSISRGTAQTLLSRIQAKISKFLK